MSDYRFAVAGFLCCLLFSRAIAAEQPSRAALDELRQQGKFDEALQLLDEWKTRDDAPDELRQAIDYHRGITLLAKSRGIEDTKSRASAIIEAQGHVQQFLKEHPEHEMARKARMELANVALEKGRVVVQMADGRDDAQVKARLLEKARHYYDQAGKSYGQLQDEVLSKANADPHPAPAKHAELQNESLIIELIQATILRERADTFVDKQGRVAVLQEAVDAYGQLYKEHRRRLAGLYAWQAQAECYHAMERFAEAEAIYRELIAQVGSAEGLRTFQIKVVLGLIRCLNDPANGKVKEALNAGKPWLDDQRPEDEKIADWNALRLAMAMAYQQQAANSETDAQRAEMLSRALENAKAAAAVHGKHQDEATELLAELSEDTSPE